MPTIASNDPYAQSALDQIIAHPNENFTVDWNVFQRISALGTPPSNAILNDDRSVSCKYFGANCVDDTKAITPDCPTWLKILHMCKGAGYTDQSNVVSQQKAAEVAPSDCPICDSIGKWLEKASSRFITVIVGLILLYGAILTYRK